MQTLFESASFSRWIPGAVSTWQIIKENHFSFCAVWLCFSCGNVSV